MRCSLLMRAALFIILVAGLARAEVVSLSVAAETPCVKESSLVAQLERAGISVSGSGVLDVDVSGTAEGVRLRARRARDGRLLVRTVPVRRGCDGVELALVALIREWSKESELPSLEVERPPVKLDAGVPVEPRDAGMLSVRAVRDAGVRLVVDAGAAVVDAGVVPLEVDAGVPEELFDAGVELVTLTIDAGQAPTPTPLGNIPLPTSPADAGAAESTPEIRVALGAGVSAVVGAPIAPCGAIVADLGSGFLGVSLEGILDGNSTLLALPGSLTFGSQSLTVSARARVRFSRVSVDLGLGVRGVRLVATSSGFTTNGTQFLLNVGPSAALTVWVRLLGPLLLMVRASTALRLPADQLTIAGGPTFTLGIWQLGVVAGLSISWP